MVKWAIASIPAVIILVVLTAMFWVAAVGFLTSVFQPAHRVSTASPFSSSSLKFPIAFPTAPTGKSTVSQEESAYRDQVLVKNAKVAEGDTGLAVFGEIKNNGNRVLKEVDITVYCLDKDAKPIFEKIYYPVLDSSFGGDERPVLKPGYSRHFGVKMNDAPSDWAKKVNIKVTEIHFE